MNLNKYTPFSIALTWFIVSIFITSFVGYNEIVFSHELYVVLVIISYILCLYYWVRAGNRFLSIYTFFVLYAFFSNAGQPLMHLMGFPEDLLIVYGDVTKSEFVDMLRFQYLCMSAFGLGVTIYLRSSKFIPITVALQRSALEEQNLFASKYDSILWFILLISLSHLLFFAVQMVVLRQSMDYGDLYEARGEWNNIPYQLSGIFSIALSYYFLMRNRHKRIMYAFLIIMILCYMISGSRGLAISFLCILIVVLPITEPYLFKKKFMPFWIVGGILIFALLSIISSNRSGLLGSQSFSTENTILMNIYGTISEMGLSARTINLTMHAINQGSMDYHQTIIYVIITSLVPFTNDLSLFQEQYISLGSWVSEYAGSFYSGLGYSFIAEAYMNFGWFGWIYVLLYGWFIVFAENTAYKRINNGEYYWALILLVILSKQVFYARAQLELIGGTLRLIEYITIVYFLFFRTSKK